MLQVAQLGHPILRKPAQIVQDISTSDIQQLVTNLIATVIDANGVGIAAPQVYMSKRIIIIRSYPSSRYPNAPMMDPLPMINPVITEYNGKQEKDWEGCLSIPGIRGFVPRAARITVRYSDRTGTQQITKFSGFVARIIQHEVDHLGGLVFLDRLESVKDIITDKEYQRRITEISRQ